MNELITIRNVGAVGIDIAQDAEARKKAVLKDAALIDNVSDAFTLEAAAEALKAVSALLKDVEICRKAVKTPVLDLGRQIDATAAVFCEELAKEKARLGQMIAEYELAVRKQREEEERRLREEQARIRAETAAAFDAAETQEEKAAAIGAAQTQLAEAKAQAVIEPRPKGLKLRKTLKFEIADEGALRAARPDLFSPDEKKIRAALKITTNIPGLKVWEETTTII